jgi:branched-chain amino acid transport system substrate-binding protein
MLIGLRVSIRMAKSLLLLAAMLALPVFQTAAGATDPYVLGVNLDLTGPWSDTNTRLKKAMQMEVERINEQGGVNGHPLRLRVKDNGFDVSQASVNMLNFARDPEVLAVIGPFEDTFQATTRAIAERQEITNLIVCPSTPKMRALEQKWSFNVAHNDLIVARKLVELCQARGYKRVLAMTGNWTLARSLAENLKRLGAKQGIEVHISKQTHKPSDIDMTPQVIKIKPVLDTKNIQAIFASTGGPTAPILCKNLRNQGIDLPILGTHAFGFGYILELGGQAVEGVEFPSGKTVTPYQLDDGDPVRPVITAFHERMLERWDVGADQISGHGYDMVWMLHDALERITGRATRQKLRDALERTSGFKGCTGVYDYGPEDHDGLSPDDLIFVRIEDQSFQRIRPEQGSPAGLN